MDRAEIVADLKNMIGPGVEVGDAGLATWVNDAYMQMVGQVIESNPDYFVKVATTSIVADQREYDLPSDFEKMVMVNAKYSGEWKRVRPMGNVDIRWVSKHADTTSASGISEAEPQYYIFGDNIGLMPIPSTSYSDALKIWYVYTPVELTDDEDEPAIPARYHHIIKYGAYASYLDQDEEHVAAERMRQRFDTLTTRMAESIADKQVDETRSVEIVSNIDMYADNDVYI